MSQKEVFQKREFSSPQKSDDTDSGTVSCRDAGDRNKVGDSKFTSRCLFTSVTRVMNTIQYLRPESPDSVMSIIRSLLPSLLGRRYMRRFTGKEYGRFIESLLKSLDNIQSYCSNDNKEQDFVKYHLAVLVCKVVGDRQLPVRPDWITKPLWVGWLRLCMARAVARRDISFINSLFQSKRAWPRLSIEREMEALRDHQAAVCSKRSGIISDDLKETITETVWGIFRDIPEPTHFMPTGGACMQAPRSKGGASSLFAPLNRKVPGGFPGKGVIFNIALNKWRQSTYADCLHNVKQRMYKDPSLLDVKIEVIAEPSKFRIISKGDGYLYTAVQPAQYQMLECWKNHYSSTMTKDLDIAVNVIYFRTIHRADWKWVSVDYKSATDLLFREVSIQALSAVQNLHETDVALYSMFRANVHYPDGSVRRQEEGQLMGHPLSFPLLCAINLSCYRTAIKRYYKLNRDYKIRSELWQNVLVNGDDMLFRAPEDFIQLFYQVTAEAGLKVSLGKNYVSSHFALINSKWYQSVGGYMIRKGYLNLKLILGTSVKTGDSSATPELIGKDLNEMVRYCPWTVTAIPAAFKRWTDLRGWRTPNWYFPVHLGGYGVNLNLAPDEWKITRSQRLIASRMMSPELEKFALYKRTGMSIPVTEWIGMVANWTFVKSGCASEEEIFQSKVTDDWLVRLAYASRASQMRQAPTKDRISLGRLDRKDLRSTLKPMSLWELGEWWNAILVAPALPACPPFLPLRSEGSVKFEDRDFNRAQEKRERNPFYDEFSGVLRINDRFRRVNLDMNALD